MKNEEDKKAGSSLPQTQGDYPNLNLIDFPPQMEFILGIISVKDLIKWLQD
jgi:hypothetical protein